MCVTFAMMLTAALAIGAPAQKVAMPVRVVIVGVVHGHIKGFLRNLAQSNDATLVPIVEPDNFARLPRRGAAGTG